MYDIEFSEESFWSYFTCNTLYAIDIPFYHAIFVTKTGCKSFVNWTQNKDDFVRLLWPISFENYQIKGG